MEPSAKIKDVMNTHRLISVKPDDDVAFAARLMSWASVRHLPVVQGRAVVGVFTERDYLRYRSVTGDPAGTDRVSQFMTSPAESVSPDDPAAIASAIMLARRIGCIPVIDEGRLVGIVTSTDMLAAEVRAAAPRVGLDTPVSQVMVPHPAVVFPHQPLLEAVAMMADRGFRHVPVTDGEGHLVGMVSDGDVRTALGDPTEALRSERSEIDEMRVSSVMTRPAESIPDEASLADAAERLARGSIGALPVVDRTDRVVGIVSYTDLVRALLDLAGGHVAAPPA